MWWSSYNVQNRDECKCLNELIIYHNILGFSWEYSCFNILITMYFHLMKHLIMSIPDHVFYLRNIIPIICSTNNFQISLPCLFSVQISVYTVCLSYSKNIWCMFLSHSYLSFISKTVILRFTEDINATYGFTLSR